MADKAILQDIEDLQTQVDQMNEAIVTLKETEKQRQQCETQIDEALCLLKREYLPLDKLLKQYFAGLIDDPDFWWAFLKAKDTMSPMHAHVHFLLEDEMPQSVMECADLLAQLCFHYPGVYCLIPTDSALKNEEQIVNAVLSSALTFHGFFSLETLQMYPRQVGKALARLPLAYRVVSEQVLPVLPQSIWSNRDVALGWAKGGGRIQNTHIPANLLEEDEELAVASFGNQDINVVQSSLPSRVLADIGKMMTMVQKDPTCICRAAPNLVGNMDLLIAALSTDHSVVLVGSDQLDIAAWAPNDIKNEEPTHRCHLFWNNVANIVHKKLQAQDIFVKLILASVSHEAKDGESPSTLAVLNQGNETKRRAFLQPMADCLGLPVGKELCRLRAARKTLSLVGFHWSDKC